MYYVEYDPFVLPFTLGALALMVMLFWKFFHWWDNLQAADRIVIRTGLRSGKLASILKEVLLESLVHRKMWRQNPWLGYMHMCFALGWFVLILIGNIESRMYSGIEFNLPYYPIFFKFFVHNKEIIPFSKGFTSIMDFFLLLVLSGLLLAGFKRFNARLFNMNKTVRAEPVDRVALYALWCVFPLRFLAESFTSGVHQTGGFLTGTTGYAAARYLPVELLAYPAWWAYSLSLCLFFVTLPFTRYMHIPAEVLLIYLRHLGFSPGKTFDHFSAVEVNACPSCGVCVEKCPMKTSLGMDHVAPAYFLKKVKRSQDTQGSNEECLLCGTCQQVCPVGIHVNDLRMQHRNKVLGFSPSTYTIPAAKGLKSAEVAYYAGCMTHLTPGIKSAVTSLLKRAGVDYVFLDPEGGICCGRPLQMAGQWESARSLVEQNLQLIKASGAQLLITSCPICLKIFKEEYKLDIAVMHHSQYFLYLVETEKIDIVPGTARVVFHDPCELGRGCGIYKEPRDLIDRLAIRQEAKSYGEESICCGGSLGSYPISSSQRKKLSADTIHMLTRQHPDQVVTACPLCKKTLQAASPIPVRDISELLEERCALIPQAHDIRKEVLETVREI